MAAHKFHSNHAMQFIGQRVPECDKSEPTAAAAMQNQSNLTCSLVLALLTTLKAPKCQSLINKLLPCDSARSKEE